MSNELSRQLETTKLTNSSSLLTVSNFYLPIFFDLTLDVSHSKPNFVGELTIDLARNERFNQDNPKKFELRLHASKLIVTSAKLANEEQTIDLKITNDRSNQQVRFTSESDIGLSETLKMTLKYMGQVNSIKTYKDITHGLFKTNYLDSISGKSNNYILATHTQPHSAKSIFPLIDELHIKVPIKLTIVTLSKFKVIANSPLIKEPEIVSLTENSRFEFAPTLPIAPSVFGFVIGDLEYLENNDLDFPVRVYTSIGESSYSNYALNLAVKFLPILENLFNFKYPLAKLDFVALPFLSDGAMENWGLIAVLSNQLLIDECTSSQGAKRQLQQLIAHELVHQWLGNLVTFDDWNNLWLNEAFATWLGNYVVNISGIDTEFNYKLNEINDLEKFLDKDCYYSEGESSVPSIITYMNNVNTGLGSLTSTIFDTNAYEKGIILLRMVGKVLQKDSIDTKELDEENYSVILKGINKVIETYKFKTIKSFDIWNILNEFTSIDLLSFIHSWLRYPGFPLVDVSYVNNKLRFEQHRYLSNLTAQGLSLEDQPYHVPLSIKIIDDKGFAKILNIMLIDRSLELDIPIDQLVLVNNNKIGYYRVHYSPGIIDQIISSITNNKLSSQDIISIINDYSKILGTSVSTSDYLISLFKIFNTFIHKNYKIDYEVLKVGLTYLETINHILVHFTDHTKFEKWLSDYILELYRKIGGWDKLTNLSLDYSITEAQVRNSILQLGSDKVEFQQLAKKLFKNFTNSGINKSFTPKELLSSIFNLSIYNSNQKEYKKIFEFVKNSNNSILNNTNATSHELQTVAISSLSFVTNNDLLNKTLNFVMTNIDSKLIELGLIGFQYRHSKEDKLKLFRWYSLHYDQWILKSLRKGSDWSKQLGITTKNISKFILGDLMQYDSELIDLKDKFIQEKLTKLPEHGLEQLIQEINEENSEKIKVADFYQGLATYIS